MEKDTHASSHSDPCCDQNQIAMSEKQAISKLKYLDNWVVLEEKPGQRKLFKTFKLAGFDQGVALIEQIHQLTKKFNHHPEVNLRWSELTLKWHTYSAQGLTDLDFAAAEACDKLYQDLTCANA